MATINTPQPLLLLDLLLTGRKIYILKTQTHTSIERKLIQANAHQQRIGRIIMNRLQLSIKNKKHNNDQEIRA